MSAPSRTRPQHHFGICRHCYGTGETEPIATPGTREECRECGGLGALP